MADIVASCCSHFSDCDPSWETSGLSRTLGQIWLLSPHCRERVPPCANARSLCLHSNVFANIPTIPKIDSCFEIAYPTHLPDASALPCSQQMITLSKTRFDSRESRCPHDLDSQMIEMIAAFGIGNRPTPSHTMEDAILIVRIQEGP
jgi:hypothetical protein